MYSVLGTSPPAHKRLCSVSVHGTVSAECGKSIGHGQEKKTRKNGSHERYLGRSSEEVGDVVGADDVGQTAGHVPVGSGVEQDLAARHFV